MRLGNIRNVNQTDISFVKTYIDAIKINKSYGKYINKIAKIEKCAR